MQLKKLLIKTQRLDIPAFAFFRGDSKAVKRILLYPYVCNVAE